MTTRYPEVPDAGPYATETWEPQPRRLDGLGVALKVLLGFNVLYGLAGVAVGLQRQGLLERLRDDPFSVTLDEAEASDLLMVAHGLTALLLYLVTGTLFIVWLFRARRNLNRLRPDPRYSSRLGENLRLGPGWAIGGWFIPLANMVIPFKVVNGVEQVSRPRPHGGVPVRGTHPVLRWWWAAWVIALVVGRVAAKSPDETLDEQITAMSWLVASDALWAVAAVFAVFVVHRITAHQRQLVDGQTRDAWLPGA